MAMSPLKGKVVDRILTEKIKSMVMKSGMDLVGFAPVSRWANAPFLLSPEAILPTCKRVVVAATHITDTWTEMGGEPAPQDLGPGGWMDQNSLLDRIAYRTARLLHEHGHQAIPVASSNIWRYRKAAGIPREFCPDLSHMHAAVAAGLGEMVWTGLTSTPEFGPRVRFISIVTDAQLVPSPLYDGPELCDRCMECVRHCPTQAMSTDFRSKKPQELKIEDRIWQYADKNIWRCAWAEHFNVDLDSPTLKTGKHVDEDVIMNELAEGRFRGHERGVCQKVCIPPHLRTDRDSFGRPGKKIAMKRVNRRYDENMPTLRIVRDDLIAEAVARGVDAVAVGRLTEDSEVGKFVLTQAPGMKTVIALAMNMPEPSTATSSDWLHYASRKKLHHLMLHLARTAESMGYYAASYTADDTAAKLAQQAGLGEIRDGRFVTPDLGDCVIVGAVTLDADLPSLPQQEEYSASRIVKSYSPNQLLRKVESLAEDQLVSLFGVVEAKTLDPIVEQLREHLDEDKLGDGVVHYPWRYHGKWTSKIEHDGTRLRSATDWLPSAQSVIVLGMHFPQEIIDNAGDEKSKQIGPYAFWNYQMVFELRFAAFEVVMFLRKLGYEATASENLLGIGSKVDGPRGWLPDFRCNALEAFSAGLGQIGRSGTLLTPQHGPHQRFITIITNASLPADNPQPEINVCQDCHQCISSCPMGAMSDATFSLQIGERIIEYPRVLRNRCDWAKRYSLRPETGPALIGNLTDVMPEHSGEVTIEELAAACEKKDPVIPHRSCILEPCLRKCPARRLFASMVSMDLPTKTC